MLVTRISFIVGAAREKFCLNKCHINVLNAKDLDSNGIKTGNPIVWLLLGINFIYYILQSTSCWSGLMSFFKVEKLSAILYFISPIYVTRENPKFTHSFTNTMHFRCASIYYGFAQILQSRITLWCSALHINYFRNVTLFLYNFNSIQHNSESWLLFNSDFRTRSLINYTIKSHV